MILKGEKLQIALYRTEKAQKPIELRDSNNASVARFYPGDDVAPYLARGYEAHGTKRIVRYLRPAPEVIATPVYVDRRPFEVDEEFWMGRGCMRFWKDQRSQMAGSV